MAGRPVWLEQCGWEGDEEVGEEVREVRGQIIGACKDFGFSS